MAIPSEITQKECIKERVPSLESENSTCATLQLRAAISATYWALLHQRSRTMIGYAYQLPDARCLFCVILIIYWLTVCVELCRFIPVQSWPTPFTSVHCEKSWLLNIYRSAVNDLLLRFRWILQMYNLWHEFAVKYLVEMFSLARATCVAVTRLMMIGGDVPFYKLKNLEFGLFSFVFC